MAAHLCYTDRALPRDDLSPAQMFFVGLVEVLVLAGGGALVLLGVTLPSYLLYQRAMDNAADEEFIVERDKVLRRARLRRNFMHGSMAAGAGLAVTGIVLAIAGYSRRNTARRQKAALSWSPQLAPSHFGAAATLRF